MPKLSFPLLISTLAVACLAKVVAAQPGPTQAEVNAAAENTTDWS